MPNGLQHLLCWWQQERAEAGDLLKACPSREWPRLVTDFRGTGAGGVGGGGSRHSELHGARGQAVIAESVVT